MNNPAQQKASARQFAESWHGQGYEKGQTQSDGSLMTPLQQAKRY